MLPILVLPKPIEKPEDEAGLVRAPELSGTFVE